MTNIVKDFVHSKKIGVTLSKVIRFFLLIAILSPSVAWSQINEATPLSQPEEKSRFESFKENSSARAILDLPLYSFYLGAPDVNGVAYVPNFSPRLGIDFTWKYLGIMTSIALPIPEEEVYRRGKSDQFSLILNRHWRQMAVDVYYQRYNGFYVASPFSEVNINRPTRYPQLPDAIIFNYGFNVYYVFDPESYSLSAAFNQNEFQTDNGGSWLLTPFYNHVELSVGGSFIPGSDSSMMQTPPDLQATKLDTLGVGFGYGYTWILDRKFLTLQGTAGPGIQLQSTDTVSTAARQSTNLALKGNLNASLGYNLSTYAFGARLLVDSLGSSLDGVQVYSTLANAHIFFGGRF